MGSYPITPGSSPGLAIHNQSESAKKMELKKYSKIKIVGHDDNEGIFDDPEDIIVIQEKVDGANFRFYITKEGCLVFGSRTQQLTSDDGEDTNMQKNFLRCANFVRDTLKDIDLSAFHNIVFFGECMVKHTMSYDWDKVPPFLGFDTYNLELGEYCDYESCSEIYDMLRLPMVPLIKTCRVKDISKVDDSLVPKSVYCEMKAEGIVFKNYKKQLMAKYVRDEFKEHNHKVFGGGKKRATDDEEYLTAVYCTNPRIEKAILKLLDDGNKLGMELMHKLPSKVYKDIWEENWEEIYNMKQKTVNFGSFKRKVSTRCLEVLKQMIVNNSLSEK